MHDLYVLIIMNIFAIPCIQSSMGGNQQRASIDSARQRMLTAARAFFRPEFLNRLDDIVTFDPLTEQQLVGIARLLAGELNERLAPKNVSLKVTDAALKLAVLSAYDPVYGARPLRRWLVRSGGRRALAT